MGKIVITQESLEQDIVKFFDSWKFSLILRKLVEKNNQYDDSWQQLGSFINVADILDKLKRAVVHGFVGDMEIASIPDASKFDEIIFDLWVRCLLTMMYRKNVLDNIEES